MRDRYEVPGDFTKQKIDEFWDTHYDSDDDDYGDIIDYLNTAEKNPLNKLVEDDPNYFYNILPYTYVLNISKKWIDTFEKKNMPNIDLSALECYENSLFMIMSE